MMQPGQTPRRHPFVLSFKTLKTITDLTISESEITGSGRWALDPGESALPHTLLAESGGRFHHGDRGQYRSCKALRALQTPQALARDPLRLGWRQILEQTRQRSRRVSARPLTGRSVVEHGRYASTFCVYNNIHLLLAGEGSTMETLACIPTYARLAF